MTKCTNSARLANKAYRRRAALKAIKTVLKMYDQYDIKASLVDMLTDIRHACDAKELPFGDLDRIAHGHYQTELMVGGER